MEMRLAEEWRKERLAAEQELAEAKRERDMVGKAQRHADARVIELAAELVELQQIQRDWFGLQERAKAAEAALFAVREALECSLPLLHTALSRIRNV